MEQRSMAYRRLHKESSRHLAGSSNELRLSFLKLYDLRKPLRTIHCQTRSIIPLPSPHDCKFKLCIYLLLFIVLVRCKERIPFCWQSQYRGSGCTDCDWVQQARLTLNKSLLYLSSSVWLVSPWLLLHLSVYQHKTWLPVISCFKFSSYFIYLSWLSFGFKYYNFYLFKQTFLLNLSQY